MRDYGQANLRADPRVARHEYELLRFLHAGGVPVPAPLRVPHPGRLVIEFIDGVSGEGVSEAGQMAGALATALARIHALDPTGRPLFLADQADTACRPTARRAASPSGRKLAGEPRSCGTGGPVAASRAQSSSAAARRHVARQHLGDGKLVAVTDWEDSAVGDPRDSSALARMTTSLNFSGQLGVSTWRDGREHRGPWVVGFVRNDTGETFLQLCRQGTITMGPADATRLHRQWHELIEHTL